jgi:O-antigen/teichoic acid export membrane protein
MVVVAVAQSMITWTDVLMLGVLKQATDIGRYQAAFQIAALLTVVLRATNAIFPPIASDLFASNAISELSQVYTAVTKWTVTVSGLGLVFLVVFSNPLLAVFSDQLTDSFRLLVVLGVGQFITVATGPVGYLLSMSGRERIESANTLAVFLLNGILNFVMIIEYGTLGAAIATAFSLAVLNLLRVFELHLISEISIQSETYTNAVGALVIGSTILVAGRFLAGTSLLVAFFTGGVAFLAFCAAVFIQGFTRTDELLFESL